MRRLLLTQLSLEDLTNIVDLDDHGIRRQPWEELARGELTERPQGPAAEPLRYILRAP